MSVKIHTLAAKWDKTSFEFDIQFSIDIDDSGFFVKLGKWMPVSYVHDWKKHDEEVSRLTFQPIKIEGSEFSKAEWVGPPVTDDWKTGYARGLDCLTEKDGSFQFHGFFTRTPVTESLVFEIEKFVKNANHTPDSDFSPTPASYFATLLECLQLHWD